MWRRGTAMNSFGKALKDMTTSFKIKNAVLAQYVQYDVSYISKWMSGKILPGEKSIERIVSGIADCILSLQDDSAAEKLNLRGDLRNSEALRKAIEQHFLNAYYETARVQETEALEVIWYEPEADLVHTVRRLEAIEFGGLEESHRLLIADVLGMEHESRLLLAKICNGRFFYTQQNPGIHLKMLVDLGSLTDVIYDCIFLMHMLTSYSMIDYQLYNSCEARGKLVYSEDNHGALSAMVMNGKHAIAVTQVSKGEQAHTLYQKLAIFFTQENLIFQNTTMTAMLQNNQYTRSLLSSKLRWLVGHVTEHFLPDTVFNALCQRVQEGEQENIGELYERANILKKSVFLSSELNIMIYDSALANLLLTGEVDFFNQCIHLTESQRLDCLRHIRDMVAQEKNQIQLIHEGFSSDFKFITNPCLFLSDSIGYLRLENACYQNNLVLVTDKTMLALFDRFYDAIWRQRKDVVVSARGEVLAELDLFIDQLKTMMQV